MQTWPISADAYLIHGRHKQTVISRAVFSFDIEDLPSKETQGYSRSLKISAWVFETVIADNKVHADDRCPNGNMKSRGEGNGRVRLNQLVTKTWVPWALPSFRVCCWSVISGSREYFVISFRPETIFLTWYENQTKKFEQTEFISKPMFNSFKLEIILFLQPCYLFSPIYFLLCYFGIIHFSFQIDMQCKLKLNPFLVCLFAELWP